MTMDFQKTLDTIKARSWGLADFDWEAPGAELLDEATRTRMKPFMSDLVWIEHIGARAMVALARSARDPVLTEIYQWFHAEEQRHANVELALMRRWGMLEDGELPEIGRDQRLFLDWFDNHAYRLSFGQLVSALAMLEVALDGALVKFMMDEVDDPLCLEVFNKINADESRHLAVGFAVMEHLGMQPKSRVRLRKLASRLSPRAMLGVVYSMALLERMRGNVVGMGLDQDKLRRAMSRYKKVGDRSEAIRGYTWYQASRRLSERSLQGTGLYSDTARMILKLLERLPARPIETLPGWVEALTPEPVA